MRVLRERKKGRHGSRACSPWHGHVVAVAGVVQGGDSRKRTKGKRGRGVAEAHPESTGARIRLVVDGNDRSLTEKTKESSGRRRGCRARSCVSRFPGSGSGEEALAGDETQLVAR